MGEDKYGQSLNYQDEYLSKLK